MKQFAIMALVSFETEVYVEAENLPEAMEKLARGEDIYRYDGKFDNSLASVTWDAGIDVKYSALDFIKPQVWCEKAQDFVPCNVVMFPVKEEVTDDEMEFEAE